MEQSEKFEWLEEELMQLLFQTTLRLAEQKATTNVLVSYVQSLLGPEKAKEMELGFAEELERLSDPILNQPPNGVPYSSVLQARFSLNSFLRELRGEGSEPS